MTTLKETSDEPKQPVVSQKGPGLRLQEARVKAGLSVDEIATHLRLRVSVIEDLEENQYENMAGLVFIKGYLRSYANTLNIDADEIVTLFNDSRVVEEVPRGSILQSRQPAQKNERPIRWLMMLIFLGVFVLSIIWWNASKPIKLAESTQPTTPLVQNESHDLLDASELKDLKKTASIRGKKVKLVNVAIKEKRTRG